MKINLFSKKTSKSFIKTKPSFTLIEILISLFLMVAVFGALASAEVFYLKSGSGTKHYNQADNLAQETFSLLHYLRDKNSGLSSFPAPGSQVYKFDNPADPTSLQPGTEDNIKIDNTVYTRKIFICDLAANPCPPTP